MISHYIREMAKKKPEIEMLSYGEYAEWDRENKHLPDLLNITDQIKIHPSVEFGYVLEFKKAKGMKINFTIQHPNVMDKEGNKMTPFTGEVYINSNQYEFFLGDTVWPPYQDKAGSWRLITRLEGKVVADKTLELTWEI